MRKVALAFVLLVSLSDKTIAQAPGTDSLHPVHAHHGHTNPLPRCDGSHFPMRLGDGTTSDGSTSCCQKGNDLYHVGPQSTILAHRQVGPACSMPLGVTPTGVDTECVYGPCGARKVVPPIPLSDPNTTVRIFEPTSDPQVCGTHEIVSGQPVDSPEPFSDQRRYPPVMAQCPYTRCLSSGKPAVTLTVIAETHNATGHVESMPPRISIDGAGTDSKVFPKDLDSPPPHPRVATLIAEPTDHHARAKFSGSCTNIHHNGNKDYCDIPLVPDPQVTVTYECHEGMTCHN